MVKPKDRLMGTSFQGDGKEKRVLRQLLNEDQCRIRRGHGPENMAVLRHIALNLLQQDNTTKAGIQTKRLKAGWDNKYLANLLANGQL